MNKVILLPVIYVLTSCASMSGKPPFSGTPTVVIDGMTSGDAQSHFTSKCLVSGGRIMESTTYSVTCAKPMGDSFGDLMFRSLFTEQNASNPDIMLQSAWAKAGNDKLRISLTGWMEHQNAFGKTTRNHSIINDEAKYVMQSKLEELKTDFESTRTASKPNSADSRESLPSNGKYHVAAQSLSHNYGCSLSLRAEEVRPYHEIYSAPCGDGYKITIACDGGNCAIK